LGKLKRGVFEMADLGKQAMELNAAGIKLIQDFEGLMLEAYRCSAGVLTIGYGHTSAAGEPFVTADMKITQAEADAIFRRDVQKYCDGVREALLVRVNDNQFSAMVSLCYNIGVVAFANSSVLRFANEGRLEEAAASFALWNKAAGQVLRGLVRRRAAEAELFSMAQA
jgi:lysozyme